MKNPIKEFFRKRVEKKTRIKSKLDSVINEYNSLINEYRLIQEKKSELPFAQRQFVVARVLYLIKKGHIQVNS